MEIGRVDICNQFKSVRAGIGVGQLLVEAH